MWGPVTGYWFGDSYPSACEPDRHQVSFLRYNMSPGGIFLSAMRGIITGTDTGG